MSNYNTISFLKRNISYSALIVLLYIISVFLDIYTTYIGTPLLKYEGNYLIVKLNLGWIQIISLSTLGVTILSTIFIYGRMYLSKNDTLNSKYILSIIGIIGFNYHFTYSVIISMNNYLSGIYLHKAEHTLFPLSENYIVFKSPFIYFYDYVRVSVLAIAIILTFIQIKTYKKDQIITELRSVPK